MPSIRGHHSDRVPAIRLACDSANGRTASVLHRSAPAPRKPCISRCAAAHRGTIGPWPNGTHRLILRAMLSFVRALGFLAPLALAAFVAVALGVAAVVPPSQRPTLVLVLGVAAAAGMTTMALIAWSYFGWRLSRIANALEHTIETDRPTHLKEAGIPAERRLARAFNAAAGAFLQTEARATHDRLTGVPNRETLLAAAHGRGRSRRAPFQAAQRRIHRHRPLQADQRHLRPQLGRRRAAPGGRAPRRVGPGQRHLRPLRRRGVHADPAGDPARGRGRPRRGAPRPRPVPAASRSPATRP